MDNERKVMDNFPFPLRPVSDRRKMLHKTTGAPLPTIRYLQLSGTEAPARYLIFYLMIILLTSLPIHF